MKLTDIFRTIKENEEEENGTQSPDKANYEVAIIPSDMQAALDALSNSENYVVKVKDEEGNEKIDTNFSRTFSDQSQIDNIFVRWILVTGAGITIILNKIISTSLREISPQRARFEPTTFPAWISILRLRISIIIYF